MKFAFELGVWTAKPNDRVYTIRTAFIPNKRMTAFSASWSSRPGYVGGVKDCDTLEEAVEWCNEQEQSQ